MRRRKRKPKLGECVLCGKLAELTSDHVPPDSMFPKGTQLITVPACLSCNRDSSGDDEYFRAAIGLRKESADNTTVQQLIPSIMRGMFRAGATGHTGHIVRTLKMVELYTPGGVFAGLGGSYTPDETRMARVAARIVRGLHYHEFKARLPATHGVAVNFLAGVDLSRSLGMVESLQAISKFATSGAIRIVHRDVFRYAVNTTADGVATVWTMVFYGQTAVLAFTGPRDVDPRVQFL